MQSVGAHSLRRCFDEFLDTDLRLTKHASQGANLQFPMEWNDTTASILLTKNHGAASLPQLLKSQPAQNSNRL